MTEVVADDGVLGRWVTQGGERRRRTGAMRRRRDALWHHPLAVGTDRRQRPAAARFTEHGSLPAHAAAAGTRHPVRPLAAVRRRLGATHLQSRTRPDPIMPRAAAAAPVPSL